MFLHNTNAHADKFHLLLSRIRIKVGILPKFATTASLCATRTLKHQRDPKEKRPKTEPVCPSKTNSAGVTRRRFLPAVCLTGWELRRLRPLRHPRSNTSNNKKKKRKTVTNLTFVSFRREIWLEQDSWMCRGRGLGWATPVDVVATAGGGKWAAAAAARTEVWSGAAAALNRRRWLSDISRGASL